MRASTHTEPRPLASQAHTEHLVVFQGLLGELADVPLLVRLSCARLSVLETKQNKTLS